MAPASKYRSLPSSVTGPASPFHGSASPGRWDPWSKTQRNNPLDKRLYAQRHLIECCFSRLKQFRRIATRYEKTAKNYRAVIALAGTIRWLK
ncbi:transposase [Rhizobium laguerreae]|uniref:Transposase n=1 Tax=Rhizobium laguerreae TaxID=1076926 RepID=A0ABR6GEQ2_9HYPH|nr:transposase [Rhizobium laguerreae]